MLHTIYAAKFEQTMNETIPSINRLFVYKAKEGRHVRMKNKNKYHTVGTVLKSNRKIVERCKNDIIITKIRSLIFIDWYRQFNKKWRN